MNKETIEKDLTAYLKQELNVEEEIETSMDLFEEGIIESVFLEKYFSFVEQKYSIEIDEKFFFDDKIASVSGLAEIILELKGT